jgi:hypothetical protein
VGNKLPADRAEMRRAGYKFTGLSTCKSCHAAIEWWVTTTGTKMPFDPAGEYDRAVPHFKTCTKADKTAANRATLAQAPQQPQQQTWPGTPASRPVYERELKVLMQRSGAICAVLVYQDGDSFSFRVGLDPEEVRNNVIATANHLRDAIRNQASEPKGVR